MPVTSRIRSGNSSAWSECKGPLDLPLIWKSGVFLPLFLRKKARCLVFAPRRGFSALHAAFPPCLRNEVHALCFHAAESSTGLQALGGEEVKLLNGLGLCFPAHTCSWPKAVPAVWGGGKGGLAWTQVADRQTMLLRSRDHKTLIFKRDP